MTENGTAMLLPWMRLWAFAARGPLKAEHKREKKISAPQSLEKGPDKNALQAEEALNRYGNSILRLAYSYLHSKADAEEVLQDTLIRLMEAATSFESEEHRKAWLLRVAGNLSKNRISYNKVRRTDELSETLTAEEREDLSFVWEAVKALPEPCREAIHLFYCEGYPTAQIARILGRKEATVRSDLHRGRARLRETLKGAYDFE